MLQVENKNIVINKRGDTADIIDETINTFSQYYNTCAELAAELNRSDEYKTCKAIFDCIIKNVKYKEDPHGVQWIRTPARLLKDGVGDCKSMAILTASVLTNLGIDCYFRFVSFNPYSKNVTHVYIVTASGIIIDPVERIDNKPVFDYAQEYTHKIDIMNYTVISRLSGIGNNNTTTSFEMWTNDTWVMENTRAANYLYSVIDMLNAAIECDDTDIELYNRRDMATVALYIYYKCTGYSDLLARGGKVLQYLADNDKFNINSIDETVRLSNITLLCDIAENVLLDLSYSVPNEGVEYEWWQINITPNDYNSLPAAALTKFKNSVGIGATGTELNSLVTQIQESAPYFLYLYMGDDWVWEHKDIYPAIYAKYVIEKNMFIAWCEDLDTMLTEETIYNYLRSGFLKKAGTTPEQYINQIISENSVNSVGVLTVAMATLIAGILTFVLGVISAILTFVANAQAAILSNSSSAGTPSEDDLTAESYTSSTLSSSNNYTPLFLAAGVAAIIFLTPTKKNKNNGTNS